MPRNYLTKPRAQAFNPPVGGVIKKTGAKPVLVCVKEISKYLAEIILPTGEHNTLNITPYVRVEPLYDIEVITYHIISKGSVERTTESDKVPELFQKALLRSNIGDEINIGVDYNLLSTFNLTVYLKSSILESVLLPDGDYVINPYITLSKDYTGLAHKKLLKAQENITQKLNQYNRAKGEQKQCQSKN